jgi:hypothetical protein
MTTLALVLAFEGLFQENPVFEQLVHIGGDGAARKPAEPAELGSGDGFFIPHKLDDGVDG